MPLRKLSSSSKVTEEQRRLAKQHQELVRQEQELNKKLQAEMQAKKAKEKQLTKINVAAVIPRPGFGSKAYRPASKPVKKLPARELQSARIKFLFLCIILVSIVVMLWRAIPS
jgi:hypothetical protein